VSDSLITAKKCRFICSGDKIYTTTAGNSYAYDSGTSLHTYGFWNSSFDLVVLSKLTAKEVKQIILESGTNMTWMF
jgi:hypothetical protein